MDNLKVYIAKNYKNAKDLAKKTGLSEAFISTFSRRDNIVKDGKLYVFKCGLEELYEQGKNDCISGVKARINDKAYLDGYGDQYELEAKEGAEQ